MYNIYIYYSRRSRIILRGGGGGCVEDGADWVVGQVGPTA